MTAGIHLRDYSSDDAPGVNALALQAFDQFKDAYTDWPVFREKISTMSALAECGEIIVAERESTMIGAVAYIGPHQPKSSFFPPEWPIMRMLVVAPQARGLGIGRMLAQECLARARRDGASIFALHTSDLMSVALPMYQRMGFTWKSSAPTIHGVPYNIYVKELAE